MGIGSVDPLNVNIVNDFRVENPINVQSTFENNGSFRGVQPPPWWPAGWAWPL